MARRTRLVPRSFGLVRDFWTHPLSAQRTEAREMSASCAFYYTQGHGNFLYCKVYTLNKSTIIRYFDTYKTGDTQLQYAELYNVQPIIINLGLCLYLGLVLLKFFQLYYRQVGPSAHDFMHLKLYKQALSACTGLHSSPLTKVQRRRFALNVVFVLGLNVVFDQAQLPISAIQLLQQGHIQAYCPYRVAIEFECPTRQTFACIQDKKVIFMKDQTGTYILLRATLPFQPLKDRPQGRFGP